MRVEGGAPLRSVRLTELEGPFADFVSLWADERGYLLNDSSGDSEELLHISVAGAGVGDVAERRGRLLFTDRVGPPLGNAPADFALTWSRRLDSLCLPPADFSTVSARSLTGRSVWDLGEPPIEDFTGNSSEGTLGGWLALLSCGFVALAMIGAAR
jgi:hypothetical protein